MVPEQAENKTLELTEALEFGILVLPVGLEILVLPLALLLIPSLELVLEPDSLVLGPRFVELVTAAETACYHPACACPFSSSSSLETPKERRWEEVE